MRELYPNKELTERTGMETTWTLATKMMQILCFTDDLEKGGRKHTAVVGTYTSFRNKVSSIELLGNETETKYQRLDSSSKISKHST